MFSCDMASRWRELHGSGHWDGLLDPLDVDLRRCLITYGEMIMATYEAFIGEHRSPNAGMCRYRHADLFRRVDVSHPGWYAATRYIYATANADVHGKVLLRPLCREGRATECNWMGYVAVATDEGAAALGRRDIVVAWRGTQRALEWVADLKLAPASAAGILGPEGADGTDPSVHRGYLSLYTSEDQCSELNKQSARMQVCAPRPAPSLTLLWLYGTSTTSSVSRCIDRDSEADGQIQGRGDQHHRHRPQPGRHPGHPERRRHRRQLVQHVQPQPVRRDPRPGHRRGVRQPAHGRPRLPRRLPPAPGPPDAPRPQPAGPHPALPAGGLRRRRRGAADRHAAVAVPQAPRQRVAVARPRVPPARRRRVARRPPRVRAGGRPGRGAGEQVRRLPGGRVPRARAMEGAPQQEHGEGSRREVGVARPRA
ncbi:phospholipase A1-II 2 isoform 1 [Oryza sativa Japonica Group]|uniref:phospholipase A1-II 2 isoform 1 n=1 Tax=Oryza sativa subsp. japonica TaxID=39947 RepID=UPI0007753C67|nr:phospholipase A1-II 2 isoform 1 [Oryza sativa Japonica Group]NP_001396361.1 phospholipase A1-II 2 isoform 1 [Oryza sativa Japonica Group]